MISKDTVYAVGYSIYAPSVYIIALGLNSMDISVVVKPVQDFDPLSKSYFFGGGGLGGTGYPHKMKLLKCLHL